METEKTNHSDQTLTFLGMKLKWYNRWLLYALGAILPIIILLVLRRVHTHISFESKVKRRLRYFNPVLTQTFWGERIKWVGRHEPLTDDELEKLCK